MSSSTIPIMVSIEMCTVWPIPERKSQKPIEANSRGRKYAPQPNPVRNSCSQAPVRVPRTDDSKVSVVSSATSRSTIPPSLSWSCRENVWLGLVRRERLVLAIAYTSMTMGKINGRRFVSL